MPTYDVIEPGFYDGHYYNPEGKRKKLTVPNAFTKKNLPSWLAPEKKPTRKPTKVKDPVSFVGEKDTSSEVEILK